MNPTLLRYVLVGFGGALVGGAATYFGLNQVLNKRLEEKWQAIADEQIESVKENYRIIRGEGRYADPENLTIREQSRGKDFNPDYPKDPAELKELADQLVDAGYVPDPDSDEDLISKVNRTRDINSVRDEERRGGDEIERTRNAFSRKPIPEGPDGAPNDPNYPYIIPLSDVVAPDEAFSDFTFVEVKYHVGDNTLLDSAGGIEFDVDGTVGSDNLKKFGHLSDDDDVIYVRNEKLSIVFEIHRIEVGYAESRGMSFDPEDEDGHIKARRKTKGQATGRFASED